MMGILTKQGIECYVWDPENGLQAFSSVKGRSRHRNTTIKALEQSGRQSLESLIELGKDRGYKSPIAWANHIWESRKRKGLV